MTTRQWRALWRAIAALVLLCSVFVNCQTPAAAHARLIASTPLSGTALDTFPAEIELQFSEPVVPSSVDLVLQRGDGSSVSSMTTELVDSEHRLRVAVDQSRQPAGQFQLLWSARSASDGHDSAGIIVSTVGTGRAPLEVGASGSARDPAWQITARALWLLALALIAARLIANFGTGRHPHPAIVIAAGAISLATSILLVRPWADAALESSAPRYQVLAGVAGLLTALLISVRRRLAMTIAAATWACALLAHTAAGHAAGVDNASIAKGIATIHTALALLWVGALGALLLKAESDRFLRVVTIYSRVALGGVLLLAIAGVAFIPLQVTGERAVTGTTYGRTLLIKLALVILVIAIAGTIRMLVRSRLVGSGSIGIDKESRIVMGAELAALALVVCLAAALAETSPPSEKTITQVASPTRFVDQTAQSGDLHIDLSAEITGTVDDVLRISVSPESRPEVGEIQRVIVSTSYLDPASGRTITGERLDANASATGESTWELSALHLTRQAIWSLEVIVRRNGALDSVATFSIDTTSWRAEPPRLTSRTWRWPLVPASAWALLGTAILVPAAGITLIRRHGQVAPLSGAILLVALAMIASGFTIQAWQRSTLHTSGHDLESPVDTNLVSAQTNYDALCLACHGPDGAGIDTIDPLHQHGSGTNLLDPRSRMLSDGDLYTLISQGIGDTDMPAYDIALSDGQRWDLVAYLRELQANPITPVITASP